MKSVFKVLVVVTVVVVCLSLVFVTLNSPKELPRYTGMSDGVFSEADFLIEVDLPGTVFRVGDRIEGTASVINNSGRNVTIVTGGWTMPPYVNLYNIKDTNEHVDTTGRFHHSFNAGDKSSNSFVYENMEKGRYILWICYSFDINDTGQWLRSEKNILIEIK